MKNNRSKAHRMGEEFIWSALWIETSCGACGGDGGIGLPRQSLQMQQEAYRFLIVQEEILRDRCYAPYEKMSMKNKQFFVKTQNSTHSGQYGGSKLNGSAML